MRTFTLALIFFCLSLGVHAQPSVPYNQFFTDQTMRVDYYHSGLQKSEDFSLDREYQEGAWPGSKTVLIDNLNLGEYMVRVFDVASGALVYSRGYSTMFNEWQTTDEAASGARRTFHETVRFPYPRSPVQITIVRRDRHMIFHEVWSVLIDPDDPARVVKETRKQQYPVTVLMDNGAPDTKVDILILGDGYAKSDMEQFRKDALHFNDVMFGTTPFKERKKDFNVRVIEVESGESGIDTPDKNLWKVNALGMSYNTFGLPRYVLSEENRTIRDIAGTVPYDCICILLNDTRYGGGGIYNLYATTYARERVEWQAWQRDYMYVHEFGHSFAGLGDEYYGSTTAYTDFYLPGVEPWEPNISALLTKDDLKWRALLSPGIELPTPWAKAEYDSLERERAKLDRLAPDYYDKREPIFKAQRKLLETSVYKGKVGAFEGAGYSSKGLYRPSIDCRMFSLSTTDFDPVCRTAIENVIDSYVR
jgi:hypothetical protein